MCKRTENSRTRLSLAAVMTVLLLAGCGGGGGGEGGKTTGNATGSGGGTQVDAGATPGTGSPATPVPGTPAGPTDPGGIQALAISGVPAGQVMVGAIYSLQPQVRHASGEVTYSVDNLPEWAEFDVATGRLVGVPLAKHVGTTRDIVIAAQDAKRRVELAPFEITVLARPSIIDLPSTPVVEETRPGRVVLTWEVPTLTEAGALLSTLQGYRVHYGVDAEAMVHVVELQGSGTNTLELEGLAAGRHYFAVRALGAGGEISVLSNIVSRLVK